MGAFQGIAQGLGGIGNDVAQARDKRLDDALKYIQTGLMVQEIQSRLKESQQKQQMANRPQLIGTPQGGTAQVPFNQATNSWGPAQTVVPGQAAPTTPKTMEQELADAFNRNDTSKIQSVLNLMGKEASAKDTKTEKPLDEFHMANEAFKKQYGRDMNFDEISKWHRQPKAVAEGGGMSEVDAYAQDLMARRITVNQIPAKIRGQVLRKIKEQGSMPPRALNAQEQRLADSIKTIEPTLDSLETIIKEAKLENDNGPIAPRTAWLQYNLLKTAPEGARGDIIRNSAALQVMGAAPWYQLGRGKYLFEVISRHLPNPEDSPKLLLDKIKFLRKIMADSKKSLGIEDSEGSNVDAEVDRILGK